MRVAVAVDWRLPLAVALAESTGQRISAILHLGREDLALDRLPYGWVQFRGEHQKNGCDHWVPLTKNTARLVRRYVRSLPAEVAFLFPADTQPTHPVDRWFMSRRLRAAYQRAGLKPLNGGLWIRTAGSSPRSGSIYRSGTWLLRAGGRSRARCWNVISSRTRPRCKRSCYKLRSSSATA